RPDGTGYPHGLSGNQICAGAQIIAITDTFYSITNERSDRTYKKSLLRAITEINAYDELQFQGAVLGAFNDLMRNIYAKQTGTGLQMA
ncbi:HD domain-containing phosphohydrolase, partial [Acinetobacter baumannii]